MSSIAEGPQRLYLFPLSYTQVPTPQGGALAMVNGSYLVVTGQGKNILIDTGWPADFDYLPGAPTRDHARPVTEHLAALGLSPERIDVVICSHFDSDHVGAHDLFPQAEFVVQREQYQIARGGHPRFAPARSHWDHPALRYCEIDGDTELLPGIRLIATSGHAPGHQSVLVSLPQTGWALLAVDAVVLERLFTVERRAWPTDDDEIQLRNSTQKLRDLVAQLNIQLVIFGHDGEQWRRLKHAPDYYA